MRTDRFPTAEVGINRGLDERNYAREMRRARADYLRHRLATLDAVPPDDRDAAWEQERRVVAVELYDALAD